MSNHDSHVKTWARWYEIEGRHFDNANRHPDHQLARPPANAQARDRFRGTPSTPGAVRLWLDRPATASPVVIALNVITGLIVLGLIACAVL